MAESPLVITVFDGNFQRKGWIGAPIKVDATARFKDVGTMTLELNPDDPRLADVTNDTAGARLVVEYKGEPFLSGWVDTRNGVLPSVSGNPTITLVDDKTVLWDSLGWPVPSAALTAQTSDYYVKTGNAETIVKDLVTQNAINRLGLNLICATNGNRGATIPGGVSIRMQPLADVLYPAVTDAGIGITVRQRSTGQDGLGLVLDCFTQGTYPRTLKESSGILDKGAYSLAGPSATRVVAGGQGDGAARTFIGQIESGREASGRIIEVFRDARDATDSTLLTARAQNTIDSTAATASLSLSLTETDTFRYGGTNGVHLGDLVTVEIRPGVQISETLTEAQIQWDSTNGLIVTPILGDRNNDPEVLLVRSISAAFRAVRNLKTR